LEGLPASNSFNLIALTNANGFKLFSGHRFSTRAQVHANFFEWSIENMIEAAKHSDFCVIPSDINDPRKSGSSSNRLLTALALGLPTAATMLPTYREFSEYFLDLESDPLALEVSEIMKLTEKVAEAQEHVIPRYSMERIGQRWVELLEPS
jgi:glycosyltransferase involved in cell wall biosynthesis